MITAIDTNVLSAIWSHEPGATELGRLLQDLSRDGALIVSAPVWAELGAGPDVGPVLCTKLLRALGLRIEMELSRKAWELAAEVFAAYAIRRRSAGAGPPRRLLADFLVGAHAVDKADRLVSRDGRFYRSVFPGLALVELPTSARAY